MRELAFHSVSPWRTRYHVRSCMLLI
jgi:hypothetical protein